MDRIRLFLFHFVMLFLTLIQYHYLKQKHPYKKFSNLNLLLNKDKGDDRPCFCTLSITLEMGVQIHTLRELEIY